MKGCRRYDLFVANAQLAADFGDCALSSPLIVVAPGSHAGDITARHKPVSAEHAFGRRRWNTQHWQHSVVGDCRLVASRPSNGQLYLRYNGLSNTWPGLTFSRFLSACFKALLFTWTLRY